MGTKKPPEGYACRACASDQHYFRDCPIAQSGPQERPRQPLKEIQRTFSFIVVHAISLFMFHRLADECWFCLSNPNLALVFPQPLLGFLLTTRTESISLSP